MIGHQKDQPLFFVVGDITTAFDTCPLVLVCKAMFAQGADPRSVAAYMKKQFRV